MILPGSFFKSKLVIPTLLITVIYGMIFQQFYFTRQYLPGQDFDVSFVSGHIMVNYLFNGFLPLWAPEQNCGSPVWPDVEAFPGFDPISLMINFIFAFNSGNSIFSHVITMFLWHLCFAAGGMLFFKKACNMSPSASVFGFTLLLFSSLTALNFKQMDDYVTVYRYVPLLAYAAHRFFNNPSYSNSTLIGLTVGLNLCGYQTPNIAVLAIIAGLAAIPMFRVMENGYRYLKALFPAAIITLLISMPLVVAGFFWISNEVVARKYFAFGYRGDLGDIFGPLVKYYPDETVIYCGLIPLVMAIAWLWRTVKRLLLERASEMSYWPDCFMLIFFTLIWIMYIGFPENFTGVDKQFLEIRSFNDMLPYVIFCGVFFAARMLEIIEEQLTGNTWSFESPWLFREHRLLVVVVVAVCITIFTELSRPSILSFDINRYTDQPAPLGVGIAYHFVRHYSLFHWSCFLAYSFMVVGLIYSIFVRKFLLLSMILLTLMVILDLSLMNIKLFTNTSGTYASANSNSDIFPSLSTQMPVSPPLRRDLFAKVDTKRWFKQSNVVYHEFSATTDDSVVWFRTSEFANFTSSITSQSVFEKLTGVTGPLIYYVNRLVKVDRNELLPTINNYFTDAPMSSAIIVNKDELPPGYPEFTGNLDKDNVPSVLHFSPNSIKLQTNLNEPAYLVYLDTYTPDWLVLIDGQKKDVIKANYLFKSVLVPAGSHIVQFIYRPLTYMIAFWCRVFGWLLGITILAVVWLKRFRSDRPRKDLRLVQ